MYADITFAIECYCDAILKDIFRQLVNFAPSELTTIWKTD